MGDIIKKCFDFKNIIKSIKSQDLEQNKDNIYISVENARKEWQDARNIFENVTNPDLIDYAIYNVDAAEKKYTYLIKQVKMGNFD